MHILLTGGGSGGHLFPLIAVARELKELAVARGIHLYLFYMGPVDIGRDALELEGITVLPVSAGKLRRYASAQNVVDLVKLPAGLVGALWKLFRIMPDAIFSKGGYGSVPALLASRVYRIPVVVHESDTIPGLANRFAGSFAKRIFTAFEGAAAYFPKRTVELVGNPVRHELAQGDAVSARSMLHLQSQKPVVFITGGSQGAYRINEVVLNTLPQLLERYELIHQCGAGNIDDVKEIVQREYRPELLETYHPYGLMHEEELTAAYAAADLIISRAGSGNIFEIAQVGKPAIIIPLSSSAANHQFENAHAYAKHGACVVLDEQNLTPNLLVETADGILASADRKAVMHEAALAFAKPDAARRIADALFDLAK